MAYSLNSKGRTLIGGKSIDESLRGSILDSIIAEGGDPASGFFPGRYSDVADRFRVSNQFVSKLWQNFCTTGEHLPSKKKSGNPSLPYESIKEVLENYSTLDGGTSLSAIGNAIRNKLPEGPFTRKRLTKASVEKFTPANTLYCQQFLNTLSALPPEKLKFCDEAGVHTGTGNPVYGNSLRGEAAVEVISGNKKGANVTLNLLCGLEGVLYANTVEGASDSTNFLNFNFLVTTPLGNPAIEFGDYIILDNCPTHRYETGNILQRWLLQMGAQIIYTPSLSPEFNVAEYVFNKMKTVLKREEFGRLLRQNVHVTIYEALELVTTEDMFGFYKFIL